MEIQKLISFKKKTSEHAHEHSHAVWQMWGLKTAGSKLKLDTPLWRC